MPRPLRIYSYSKIYHIILKGIDSQDIFYNDQDREFFLKQLSITTHEYNNQIYAYCLMDNHVHLVIKAEDEILSKSIQSLSIRYVQYFNKKYKRTGSLFQDRFKSKKVEDKNYFLEVCRYVHRNPENASVAKTAEYKWSSYKEYIGREKIINKKILLHYFNNDIKQLVEFTAEKLSDNINNFAEYELIEKLTDSQLIYVIAQKFQIDKENIGILFRDKSKKEIEKNILRLKEIKRTNKTQISRVIRVGRSRITRIWNRE